MSIVSLHRLNITQNISVLPGVEEWQYLKFKYQELVTAVKVFPTSSIELKFHLLLKCVKNIVIPKRGEALRIGLEYAQNLTRSEEQREEGMKHRQSHPQSQRSVDLHSDNVIAMSKDEVVTFLRNWLFQLVPKGKHPILPDPDSPSSSVQLLPDFLPFITTLLPEDVRNDEQVVALLIRIEPLCLGFLDFASMKIPEFRVLSRGLVLRYASPSFKKDAIDLMKDVRISEADPDIFGPGRLSVQYDHWLPANPPVGTTRGAVHKDVVEKAKLEPTIDELMRRRDIVSKVIEMDGRVLKYMNEEFRQDTNLRIIACKTDPGQALDILNDMLEDSVSSKVINNLSMLKNILLGREFQVSESASGEATKEQMNEASVLLADIIGHYSEIWSKNDMDYEHFSVDKHMFAERIIFLATEIQAKLMRPGGPLSEMSGDNFARTRQKLNESNDYVQVNGSLIGGTIEEHFSKVASVKRL